MEGLSPIGPMHFAEHWARELEQRLPQYLLRQRWFGGKARTIRQVHVVDSLRLQTQTAVGVSGGVNGNTLSNANRSLAPGKRSQHDSDEHPPAILASEVEDVFWLLILAVHYADGGLEFYTLPATLSFAGSSISEESVIVRWSQGGKEFVIAEATRCPEFWLALVALLKRQANGITGTTDAQAPSWSVVHTRGFTGAQAGPFDPGDVVIFAGEQSQSLAVLRQSVVVKLFRHFEIGISPDWEICRFLTEQQHFPHIPAALAALEYRPAGLPLSKYEGPTLLALHGHGEPTTLVMMSSYRHNRGDAWSCLLAELPSACDRVLTEHDNHAFCFAEPPELPDGCDAVSFLLTLALDEWQEDTLAQPARTLSQQILLQETYTARMSVLGQRTAELHLALANSSAPAFVPEPIDPAWQRAVAESCARQIEQGLDLLRARVALLAPATAALADRVLQYQDQLHTRAWAISQRPVEGQRIRIHGDYHLGQVLCTQEDFVFLDFEGEPTRSLAERRRKQCPLRDVAGMIRSFHYAMASTWRTRIPGLRSSQRERICRWLEQWYVRTTVSFLRGYLKTPRITTLLPRSITDLHMLLSVFLLEKAAYELAYELNHRPDWVEIPLQGLLNLMSGKFDTLVCYTTESRS